MSNYEIQYLPPSSIHLNQGNPRLIKNAAFKNLVKSLKDCPSLFDARPCICSDRTGQLIVVGGNMRLRAAIELKYETVPVIVMSGLTEDQEKEIAIKDNGGFGQWDFTVLADAWGDLPLVEWGVDLPEDWLTGKNPAAKENEFDAEAEAEAIKDPVTKMGDVWLLDRHRVMCGDSTKKEDVERLMDGKKTELCFTSPPYGQQRDYGVGKVSDWDVLMHGVFSNLPMSEDGQVLVNLGLIHRDGEWIPYWQEWIEWMRSTGWRRFGWYVWDQGSGLPGDWNGRLGPSHEFVFHFNKKSVYPVKWVDKLPESIEIGHGTGMRGKNGKTPGKISSPEKSLQPTKIPDSVIRVMRHKGRGIEIEHPAVFPVKLPEFFIKTWLGSVYDPFCGSGTTLIACEQLNRTCYGMEIDPIYCDVIIKRWENLTGKAAKRENDARA